MRFEGFRRKFPSMDKVKSVGRSGLIPISLAVPYALSVGNYTAINWTYITNIVEGAASILPSFVTLIVNAVPILIILAVVGFVIGFFDSILSAISSAGRMFK